ncbi:unnamed protein product [Spirodela intermedia]|uniref:Uncharacterized protein n=1 Tax=Spirodela intermedia TaxID=51605 RepID=A0A7I8JAE1_SPIIN|nr:unnamed protein product [Spirodela intermedia]CAA6666745.1 unnamed protein product [Spirodela intermedia]
MAASSNNGRWVSPLEKARHERSTSLPSHSHPVIAKLEGEVHAAGDVAAPPTTGQRSADWLRSALSQLQRLHLAADDLLLLPCIGARLLDDLLCYADAFGSLRMALVSVQDLCSEAQAALRRRDGARLVSAARSLRRAQKEISALPSVLPAAASGGDSAEPAGDSVELPRILREVKSATLFLSTSVFQGVASALSSAVAALAAPPKSLSLSSWTAWRRWRSPTPCCSSAESEEWMRRASQGLKELEERVLGLESGSEAVYRVLIGARVSLLNVLTP